MRSQTSGRLLKALASIALLGLTIVWLARSLVDHGDVALEGRTVDEWFIIALLAHHRALPRPGFPEDLETVTNVVVRNKQIMSAEVLRRLRIDEFSPTSRLAYQANRLLFRLQIVSSSQPPSLKKSTAVAMVRVMGFHAIPLESEISLIQSQQPEDQVIEVALEVIGEAKRGLRRDRGE